jgi:hypothetical protein
MREKPLIQYIIVLFSLSALLVACNLEAPKEDDAAIQTAIALTFEATEPKVTLSPTSTSPPNPTTIPIQETGDTDQPESLRDIADFVGDITIPDFSYIETGTAFTKTWRLQNISELTWTTDYQLVFVEGDLMGAPENIFFPEEVPPGGLVDLSVDFTAPDTPGEYRSDWILQNANGENFGLGEKADLPIFTIIYAIAPEEEVPGGVAGGATITLATITVNNPNYSGSCPATLTFSGGITTSNGGTVLWSLTFDTSTSGFTFDPSGSYSLNYGSSGTQYWQYTLFVSSSVNASARLIANGTNSKSSGTQTFTVNCQ